MQQVWMPYKAQSSKLRAIARANPRFVWTHHAIEEMEKDSIFKIDIMKMLQRCTLTLIEYKQEEEWRAEGKDNDGRSITVVMVVYEQQKKIKVITAWVKGR
jgi:hypothetical protein